MGGIEGFLPLDKKFPKWELGRKVLMSSTGPFGFPLGFARGFGKTGQAGEAAVPT